MYFSFDKFNRYEIPEMVLCNPNFNELAAITPSTAPKMSLRFNAISEASFKINSDIPYYDKFTKNRVIHIDGFGYWVIDGAPTDFSGGLERMEVNCFSYEYMLTMRNADIAAGTYNFYDVINPKDTLLGTIQRRCPSWKIGYVSPNLCGKYRTFDMPDSTVYSFLTADVSEAYEAIFVFDNENLTINAYTADEIVNPTDIVFTWDNLMKSVKLEETDDPVITALDVYGAGNISISSANPLGTPTIYKFDYYKDQMTTGLWSAIEKWKDEIAAQTEDYNNLLAQRAGKNNLIIEYNSEISDARTMLDSGKQIQDVSTPYSLAANSTTAVNNIKNWIKNLTYDQRKTIILDASSYPVVDFSNPPSGITTYVNKIVADDRGIAQALVNIYICEQFITETNALKKTASNEIEAYTKSINDINEGLSLSNNSNFTKEQLLELDKFILGTTYTNEYFVLSENYTFADMQELAQELYEQGEDALDRISQPTYNFSLETANFLFMKEYEHFANQCKLGCVVNAEIREDEWVSPILLEIDIDFHNPDDFSMVWGSRYRLQTAEWTWAELNNQVNKTSGVVSANFSDMIKPVRSGDLDRFAEFMNSALDTAKNAVLAGNHQAMMIDSHGVLGRKSILDSNGNPIEGEYESEQIKMLNNGIYFTRDNWNNCSMAVGKIAVGDGYMYGVVADALVGSMLIGNNLSIVNESGNFSVDGSGVSFSASSDNARIIMNPAQGFHMQTKSGSTWVDKIAMDMTGKVTLAGELISMPDISSIGGWDNEDSGGLQKTTTSNFARLGGSSYAFSAGTKSGSTETAKFSVDYNGKLIAADGTFYGIVAATTGNIGALVADSKGVVISGNLSVTGTATIPITPRGLGISSGSNMLVTAPSTSNFGSLGYTEIDVMVEGSNKTYKLLCTGTSTTGSGTGTATYNVVKKTSSTPTVYIRTGPSTTATYVGEMQTNVWYVYNSIVSDRNTYYVTVGYVSGSKIVGLPGELSVGYLNLSPTSSSVQTSTMTLSI